MQRFVHVAGRQSAAPSGACQGAVDGALSLRCDATVRVALLVRRWSVTGGVGRSAVELARHLLLRGHQVRVLAQKDDRSASSEVPVEVERLGGLSFDPVLSMRSFAKRAERAVIELRRERRIDVVLGFEHATLQDVFRLGGGVHAEFLARTAGIRPRPGGFLLDPLALRLEQKRFRPERTGTLVAVSTRGKDDLLRHYAIDPARVKVVLNGVDLGRFSPEAPEGERARVRGRWGVGPNEPVALLVGQNPILKGLDLAARAVQRAHLRLVYAGGAGRRPRWCPPEVIWDGVRADLASSYRSADVLLQPSRYENFGNVVLEAAACGLPAVAPAWVGSAELLAKPGPTELTRLMVDVVDDIEALASRLSLALDGTLRPRLVSQALARSRDASASWSRWATEMEAVLETASHGG
jgi:UDP-glucose:(heptosyl)LPS alpha-1,3-glucosyltransferase